MASLFLHVGIARLCLSEWFLRSCLLLKAFFFLFFFIIVCIFIELFFFFKQRSPQYVSICELICHKYNCGAATVEGFYICIYSFIAGDFLFFFPKKIKGISTLTPPPCHCVSKQQTWRLLEVIECVYMGGSVMNSAA